jgi:predicted ATP-dependent endonuclease of OLD family
MKTIGFKNFRRFENLEPLQLGGVNFFVGGNNSGKSTVVKAFMLLMDNLDLQAPNTNDGMFGRYPLFRLDANHIHNVHIGTFGRALHKPYPEVKEIVLEGQHRHFHFSYTIVGDEKATSANAHVKKIELTDLRDNVRYVFDFEIDEFSVFYNKLVLKKYAVKSGVDVFERLRGMGTPLLAEDIDSSDIELYEQLKAEEAALNESLKTLSNPIQIAQINSRLNLVKKQLDMLGHAQKSFKDEEVTYKASLKQVTFSRDYISSQLDEQWRQYNDHGLRTRNLRERKEVIESYQKLSSEEKAFLIMLSSIGKEWRRYDHFEIEYIPAHVAAQKVLFSIEDKNDYMGQVIRDFMGQKITRGSYEYSFIQKWMNRFEIGIDFEIQPIEGEAYTMNVTKGDYQMPLADFGMGSIQIILLLLRLATIISKNVFFDRIGNVGATKETLVIIEEPEQNIHPKWQSKLADLFAYVNKEFGFRFIIETHSEYIIRRTQAMIATGEVPFEQNPFKVYYFPENGQPYDMEYQKSGRFVQSFGHGFFDESAKHTMEISKKELQEEASITFNWDN